MSYETSVKKSNEMLALARSGVTVWWRRDGFNQEPFRGVEPKWHVLTGRLAHHNSPETHPNPSFDPLWTALCGYQKIFDERIFNDFPNLRKTAPKKDTRCRKCIAELPALLERIAIEQAVTVTPDSPLEKEGATP